MSLETEGVRMPFGKYKGELLENVPSDYLMWITENLENERRVDEAQNQLDARAGRGIRR